MGLLWKIWAIAVAVAVIAFAWIIIVANTKPAHGHDHWISNKRLTDPQTGQWCCSLKDCRPEIVSEVIGGYLTLAGDVVPYSRVIWRSQDGQSWRCRNLTTNATRCLILPPPGS